MRILLLALISTGLMVSTGSAQALRQTKGDFADRFRQLDETWPDPSAARLATGAPGPGYWQQDVDYEIAVRLDEAERRIEASENVTYTNNSPHTLSYLWLQLDQNRFAADSLDNRSRTTNKDARIRFSEIRRQMRLKEFEGGYDISNVEQADGTALSYDIVDTNMRIDLAEPLKPGETVSFSLDFAFNIIESDVMGGRGGYECFEGEDEDGNCIFLTAQWFPRLHAYSDYEGWHNKPFLGRGEFTLEFGDYEVDITVPADHVVSATGVLDNPAEVLSETEQARLDQARERGEPVFIVTPSEARAAEQDVADNEVTWRFEAENVRDFAWASSRKFIWDAMTVEQDAAGGDDVLAMSFYPNEAEPLWSAYSTKSVAHTIDVYSRYSFAYPYPTAQSVNGPVGGMEYPMITFNGPRPKADEDGNLTYSRRTKYGLISVIIHEIGHIYFPMTVNSDERQWTWMDEGLNTFLQYLAEAEWERDYPSRRGAPDNMTDYMISQNQVPIMTQSDSIQQFGNNAYGKPATALVILRETILGRERFDRAFREYARRWQFKRPTPYDFFRTMEESSGVDLDWFWRGWFYSTDHVDLGIDAVEKGRIDTRDPRIESDWDRGQAEEIPDPLTELRNEDREMAVERDPALEDFYNRNDRFAYGQKDVETYENELEGLEDWQREALASDMNFYRVTLSNKGGLVMPVILELAYGDGETEIRKMPAEIWRRSPDRITRLIVTEKEIASIELDPRHEIADADRSNNHFPQRIEETRLEAYKRKSSPNLMERMERKVAPDSLETLDVEAEPDGGTSGNAPADKEPPESGMESPEDPASRPDIREILGTLPGFGKEGTSDEATVSAGTRDDAAPGDTEEAPADAGPPEKTAPTPEPEEKTGAAPAQEGAAEGTDGTEGESAREEATDSAGAREADPSGETSREAASDTGDEADAGAPAPSEAAQDRGTPDEAEPAAPAEPAPSASPDAPTQQEPSDDERE